MDGTLIQMRSVSQMEASFKTHIQEHGIGTSFTCTYLLTNDILD